MIFVGNYCTLEPLVATKHLDDLWKEAGMHEDIWKYKLIDFKEKQGFAKFLTECEQHKTRQFFTIIVGKIAVGALALMDISEEHKRLEIGAIFFGKSIQKTRIGTEAVYLLLKHSFESLNLNRVEWHCNKLNEASKKSALRFGFIYEGMLRSHMISKNTIRDTLVFSIIKEEWQGIKTAFEKWLLSTNFDENGIERAKFRSFLN
jgi:RimJ/RimL family protein N-acetyltransferase